MITVSSAYADEPGERRQRNRGQHGAGWPLPTWLASRTNAAMMSNPGIAASNGSAEKNADVTPYTTSQRTARGGRSAGPSCRARPTFAAGDPAQRSPSGTSPDTQEPGAHLCARADIRARTESAA